MSPRTYVFGLIGAVAAIPLARSALADITSIRGSATAIVSEFHADGSDDRNEVATAMFPETTPTLPLQVVARLVDLAEDAAGMTAAQFADPRTAIGEDPDEFAINVALSSVTPDVRYTAQATTEEIRDVLFTPAELGVQALGQSAPLLGRVFLDGALAIFAGADVTDLTGASVALRVTVMQEVEGQAPQQVFTGKLDLTGGAARQVTVARAGSFPLAGVFSTDLAGVDAELGVFRVVVFPSLAIDYSYEATAGQPFALHAKVEIDAANIGGDVGVAVLLGTPFTSLSEVLALTQGSGGAEKMVTAMLQERAEPTGVPAFSLDQRLADFPLFGLFQACGLFGVESALGITALVGLRLANPYRRRARSRQ